MQTAILRAPSPGIARCELTHIERIPIDPALAVEQHKVLTEILQKCNYSVITLPALADFPDSVFVEDTALVLPEGAILLPLGAESRKGESEMIRKELSTFRNLKVIDPTVRIEGGDVLRLGKTLFVGMTSRTDTAGAEELRRVTAEWGYTVSTVEVEGSLHLKTAVTAPDDGTVVLNSNWVASDRFQDFRIIEADPSEPFAGNVLRLGEFVVAHKGFPRTVRKLREAGFDVIETDISEFLKAEAGLTCLCVLIED